MITRIFASKLAKALIIAGFSLGLAAGCASTGGGSSAEPTGEQAIADAKAANKKAKSMGYEWRDTGKMIKKAEEALAAEDEAKAIKIANKARRQGESAVRQAGVEQAKFDLRNGGAKKGASAGAMMRHSGSADQYSVNRGDNLWSISGQDQIYADYYQWPLIYKANRHQIKDADLIYPGQVFDIDRSASSSDIDAAIRHARTRGAWSLGGIEDSDRDYLGE